MCSFVGTSRRHYWNSRLKSFEPGWRCTPCSGWSPYTWRARNSVPPRVLTSNLAPCLERIPWAASVRPLLQELLQNQFNDANQPTGHFQYPKAPFGLLCCLCIDQGAVVQRHWWQNKTGTSKLKTTRSNIPAIMNTAVRLLRYMFQGTAQEKLGTRGKTLYPGKWKMHS